MKRLFFLIMAALPILASAQAKKSDNLVQYVHPIIGTQRMGHVFPGATVPFGMVQLSPETDTEG